MLYCRCTPLKVLFFCGSFQLIMDNSTTNVPYISQMTQCDMMSFLRTSNSRRFDALVNTQDRCSLHHHHQGVVCCVLVLGHVLYSWKREARISPVSGSCCSSLLRAPLNISAQPTVPLNKSLLFAIQLLLNYYNSHVSPLSRTPVTD